MPDTAAACLRCQDEAGADVTVLLYLLWRAADGWLLDGTSIAAADAAVSEWRTEVVQPLRAVRRALKPTSEAALRSQVAAAELAAERIALARLAALPVGDAAARAAPRVAARTHLAAYGALPTGAVATLLTAFAAQQEPRHG